jgi:23S rRNA (adenine2503-C2)-methyltransferase
VDKDLKSKTFGELERLVVGLGQKKYIAGYIFGFIHTKGASDVSAITPLSKSFRARLIEQGYYISALQVVDKLTDPDGTVKYIFGLPDGNKVESVLLFDDDRRTLCVSTQVGCAMGCVFCATGRGGLKRNLTMAEIVDQVNVIADCRFQIADCNDATGSPPMGGKIRNRISNVVFMGMGEPLANYKAVLDAVRILNHPKGRKIGIRRITISTCGLPEGIERLAGEDIQPRLAISLNAPNDAIRQKLMPVARKYPLDRLFRAVEVYQRKTRNRVTFEYCMIKGVNDTVLHARMLAKRLRGVLCNVNLIEYNSHSGCDFKPSSQEAIEWFAKTLNATGLETTVRLKMGQTINAACGQLGAGW